MPNPDPLSRFAYSHHATAFGVSGQIDRPTQQAIQPQASVSLSPSGGHGTHRVEGYRIPGVLSFSAAYVHVSGSLDDINHCHTTIACSVIEDLNVCDTLTADKVVARLTVYHPSNPSNQEFAKGPNFSIAGSYFENLRLAGRKVDIELAADPFNSSTYDSFQGDNPERKPAEQHRDCMLGSHIDPLLDDDGKFKDAKLEKQLEHNSRIVKELGKRFREWDVTRSSTYSGSYQCSAAKHADLESALKDSGLVNYGGIVCVPRFGVIHLAELIIHKSRRELTMFRVMLGSPGSGNIDGGNGGGGGTAIPPG